MPGSPGAYVATGHGCWGVLCGPITGLAMAELLMDGRVACVDLGAYSPSRWGKREGEDG